MTSCPIPDHYSATITHICANPACTQSRLLCNQCLGSLHPTCGNYILNIDAVVKKDYLLNSNWIQSKPLRDALVAVEKYKLTSDKDQMLKSAKAQIEKEYAGLIDFFTQQVYAARDRSIKRFMATAAPPTDINFQDFSARIKNVYNFTTFNEIITQWRKGTQSADAITRRLDLFFKFCGTNEQSDPNLTATADRINTYTQQCMSVLNTLPFDQFKNSIANQIYQFEPEIQVPSNPVSMSNLNARPNVPPASNTNWTWDAQKISTMLELTPDGMIASKKEKQQWRDSAVLGNLTMSKGRFQWGIDVGDVNTRWICFGVIEPQFAGDLENFDFANSNGFSLLSQRYNMIGDAVLPSYRNTSYVCDLDLMNGTFTISSGDKMLAKEKESLKGKTFIPYVVLYMPGNAVSLRMIGGMNKTEQNIVI